MTIMSERPRASQRAGGEQPPPRVRRTLELWLVGIGMALSLVGLGGFTLVMNQADQATFESVIMPALTGTDPGMASSEAYQLDRTLAAWLGVTFIVLLMLLTFGDFLSLLSPGSRSS